MFTPSYRKSKSGGGVSGPAIWRRQRKQPYVRDTYFDYFPFEKTRLVEVEMHAPEHPGELVWMWEKSCQLAEVMRHAKKIPRLKIRFAGGDFYGWCDETGGMRGKITFATMGYYQFDHNFLVNPFFGLRQLERLEVEADSEEVGRMLDWKSIEWNKAVIDIKSVFRPESHLGAVLQRELNDGIVESFIWGYWTVFTARGREMDIVRMEWFRAWYERGSSGASEFETHLFRVIREYPSAIRKYDKELEDIRYMHYVLINLHHYAMTVRDFVSRSVSQEFSPASRLRLMGERMDEARGNNPRYWLALYGRPGQSLAQARNQAVDPDWDPDAWLVVFKEGIPAYGSQSFEEEITPILDICVYNSYEREAAHFAAIPRLIQDLNAGARAVQRFSPCEKYSVAVRA